MYVTMDLHVRVKCLDRFAHLDLIILITFLGEDKSSSHSYFWRFSSDTQFYFDPLNPLS